MVQGDGFECHGQLWAAVFVFAVVTDHHVLNFCDKRLGERFGLSLDPSRYADARAKAIEGIRRHPELEHDEEIWVAFTERIIRNMGGDADSAYDCAVAMTKAWEHAEHFELFEDAPPVLEELRAHGLKLGLVSNTGRDLDEFVAHHHLDVDAVLGSGAFGRTKPHPTIFQAVLERLEVEPGETTSKAPAPPVWARRSCWIETTVTRRSRTGCRISMRYRRRSAFRIGVCLGG